jgi:chromatin remodeling complex protein RSC6
MYQATHPHSYVIRPDHKSKHTPPNPNREHTPNTPGAKIYYSDAGRCEWRKECPRKTAKNRAKNSSFMKPMQHSEDLAEIVGAKPLPRTEVTKKVWAHIKKHKLQNPKNKREILADDKLQPIFGAKKLNMFQMTKAINKHLK